MTDAGSPRVESGLSGVADRSRPLLERGGRARALCKALCYRVLMLCTTLVIALAVTGDPGTAIDLGVATTVVKTATYYGYERLWNAL
ncbi:DUF2061 domain-containing protein [Natrinema pallidum]|nr:DUF2061 domain-containing protein [Natrinema pallidum]